MATERAEFLVTLDAEQARAELEKIRAGAVSFGGSVEAVTARVDAMRARQLELARALSSGDAALTSDRAKMEALRQELESTTASLTRFTGQQRVAVNAQQSMTSATGVAGNAAQGMGIKFSGLRASLGASAAAVSLVSSALGEQAGAAGKVINIGGQMLAAFGAGGPYGLALAAGVAGVSLLTSHWDDLIKKEDEALRKQYLATDDASAILRTVENDIVELQTKTMGASAAAFARVGAEISQVQAKRDSLAKGLFSDDQIRRLKELRDAGMSSDGQDPAALLATNENHRQALDFLDKAIEKLKIKQGLESAQAAGGLGNLPPGGGDGPQTVKRLGTSDLDAYTLAKYGISFSEVQKGREDEAHWQFEQDKIKQKALDDEADAERAAAQDKIAIAKRVFDAKAYFDQQRLDAIKHRLDTERALEDEALQGATSNAISAVQILANGLVTGQKDAFQQATSAFLKSEGQQLVGIGTKAVFEGLAISANPLTPGAGAPMIAVGAAAIAAGVGMGAAGAALAPASAPTNHAATDRGVNRSSGSGSRAAGSGSGVTINVVYGAAGPAPQDTGREVNKALQAYLRSSGARLAGPQGPSR